MFRRGLRRGDPPARVEPLRVTLKPGARPARPRVYNPVKTAWLAACMASLAALGLVFFNMQSVWASAAVATPKNGGVCLVSDFRAANQRVEKVPGVMPNQEASMAKLRLNFTAVLILARLLAVPVGTGSGRDFYDRYAGRFVYA